MLDGEGGVLAFAWCDPIVSGTPKDGRRLRDHLMSTEGEA
jgi:hypothetical protein